MYLTAQTIMSFFFFFSLAEPKAKESNKLPRLEVTQHHPQDNNKNKKRPSL